MKKYQHNSAGKIEETTNGVWVLASDYDALAAECERLREVNRIQLEVASVHGAACADIRRQRDAAMAELAALKGGLEAKLCMGCVEQSSRIRELEHKMDYYTAPPAQASAWVAETSALRDVLAERQRQVTAEGFDASHDDMATRGQIAMAAGLYAIESTSLTVPRNLSSLWPWPAEWWKPSEPRRNLIKAGALILAEIERLDRAAAPTPGASDGKGGE